MRTSALAPIALAAALLLTIGGCAADEPTSTDDTSQSSSDDDDEETDDTEATEESDDTATSDLVPVLTNEPAAGGPQVAITADGFEPSDLTVSAGDVVTFT